MFKKIVVLGYLSLLGSSGMSQATPLDSPDVVYVDGLPCNRLCQSYMAWSRDSSRKTGTRSAAASARMPSRALVRGSTGVRGERSKSAPHLRVAKQAALSPRETPRAKAAELQPANRSAAESDPSPAKNVDPHPAVDATPGSGTTRANVVNPPSSADGTGSITRTVQEQVTAATAIAERITVATLVPAAQPKNDTDHSKQAEPAANDAQQSAGAEPNTMDLLVALLLARPEINAVSDLTSKSIAIDGTEPANSVRTAIAAAGATEVQLSEAPARAIDRLIGGEVPAAVLALVSPEAAEGFPEIAGFRIFRIPLSPR
jgi:hypothetical protein